MVTLNELLQREIRLRNALKNALGAWVSDTAGETGSPEVYKEAEAAIVESEAAMRQFDVTSYQLSRIMPNLPTAKLGAYWPYLNEAMAKYEINTPLRVAAFLAQLAHESGELKYFEEIWGPTAAQKRYELPHAKARELGNIFEGDGFRYRGRGPIQLTGRANYKKYGELLGVDLVNNPDLAATPEWAFQTAAVYWKIRGLNELADGGSDEDFKDITKKINGGLTNLADRQKYYERALAALGVKSKEGE